MPALTGMANSHRRATGGFRVTLALCPYSVHPLRDPGPPGRGPDRPLCRPRSAASRYDRRKGVFFGDDAFTAICCGRLATRRASTSFANCLTPNHVHLILTPATADGLARALGKAPHGRGLLRVRIGVRTGPA